MIASDWSLSKDALIANRARPISVTSSSSGSSDSSAISLSAAGRESSPKMLKLIIYNIFFKLINKWTKCKYQIDLSISPSDL